MYSLCCSDHICVPFIDFMILWLHGENGTGPAKFSVPHSVTVDSDGRVNIQRRCGLSEYMGVVQSTDIWAHGSV